MFGRALNARTLAHHAARVRVPTYDRAALRRGVVHISVGSFHRSHQAVYFDDLACRGLGDGWALTGVGLHRRDMQAALGAQDGLYTVVERGPGAARPRVVGVITRYLFAPDDVRAVVRALADPRTRVVTLTITADGYRVDRDTGSFAGDDDPCSALGLLVEALDRRRRAGRPPFTVLSCDNMPANGAIARAAVVGEAARRDPALARWIDERGAFPSSMVDRITPTTTQADRELLAREFGVRDRWPVMTEPFSQWIVEDEFCHGRPPLDEVGVQFVRDVSPYALTKTRLLNGVHSALGYVGSLGGHARIDEVMADPPFAAYAERMMDEEIAPLLPRVPGIELPAYCSALSERLGNAAVGDRLSRLCRNGSTKVPRHLLSSIREARALGRPHPRLTLAVAAWCRYLRTIGDEEDPAAARLRSLARAGGDDPRPLLADGATFGSVGADPDFAEAVARDIRALGAQGARAVVAARSLTTVA
jgi:mannitol-1-phosphate/altronate dehydrogenase